MEVIEDEEDRGLVARRSELFGDATEHLEPRRLGLDCGGRHGIGGMKA